MRPDDNGDVIIDRVNVGQHAMSLVQLLGVGSPAMIFILASWAGEAAGQRLPSLTALSEFQHSICRPFPVLPRLLPPKERATGTAM